MSAIFRVHVEMEYDIRADREADAIKIAYNETVRPITNHKIEGYRFIYDNMKSRVVGEVER